MMQETPLNQQHDDRVCLTELKKRKDFESLSYQDSLSGMKRVGTQKEQREQEIITTMSNETGMMKEYIIPSSTDIQQLLCQKRKKE